MHGPCCRPAFSWIFAHQLSAASTPVDLPASFHEPTVLLRKSSRTEGECVQGCPRLPIIRNGLSLEEGRCGFSREVFPAGLAG